MKNTIKIYNPACDILYSVRYICSLAANWKSKVTITDCPNTSVAFTTTVCASEPNLLNSNTRGKAQISAGPPSNEHTIDTSWLFD